MICQGVGKIKSDNPSAGAPNCHATSSSSVITGAASDSATYWIVLRLRLLAFSRSICCCDICAAPPASAPERADKASLARQRVGVEGRRRIWGFDLARRLEQ